MGVSRGGVKIRRNVWFCRRVQLSDGVSDIFGLLLARKCAYNAGKWSYHLTQVRYTGMSCAGGHGGVGWGGGALPHLFFCQKTFVQ